MKLTDRIAADLMAAMKAREERRLSSLRMLKTELQKLAADKGRSAEIADEDVHTVIRRLIKQRREAAEQYAAGGARDRAEAELAEAAVLEPYLPAQLEDAALDEMVRQAAQDTGASGPRDMGRLMKAVLALAAGRADGARVKDRVTAYLNR